MKKVIFAALATVILLVLIICTACTPLSTRPFEPTLTQDVAAEQRKTIVEGKDAPHSGMDCRELIAYQIAYCEATLSCTAAQYNTLKRAARRLRGVSRSQCLYSKGHIQEVYRHMDSQRGTRPFGR